MNRLEDCVAEAMNAVWFNIRGSKLHDPCDVISCIVSGYDVSNHCICVVNLTEREKVKI